jgi:hypothetical protein
MKPLVACVQHWKNGGAARDLVVLGHKPVWLNDRVDLRCEGAHPEDPEREDRTDNLDAGNAAKVRESGKEIEQKGGHDMWQRSPCVMKAETVLEGTNLAEPLEKRRELTRQPMTIRRAATTTEVITMRPTSFMVE